jgi:hypothetical protein
MDKLQDDELKEIEKETKYFIRTNKAQKLIQEIKRLRQENEHFRKAYWSTIRDWSYMKKENQQHKQVLESLKEQIDQGYSYDEIQYAIEKALEGNKEKEEKKMGQMSQEEINVPLFDEVKRLREENLSLRKSLDEERMVFNLLEKAVDNHICRIEIFKEYHDLKEKLKKRIIEGGFQIEEEEK